MKINKHLYANFLFLFLLTGELFAHGHKGQGHAGITGISSLLTSSGGSEGIQNGNSPYTFVLNGVAGENAYCNTDPCSPVLGYLDSQYVTVGSGGWFNLGYDMCIGVNYDDSGNASCSSYIGGVNLQFSSSPPPTVSSATGGTAALAAENPQSAYPVIFTPNPPSVYGIQNATTGSYYSFSSSSEDALSSCCSGNSSSCTSSSCATTLAPGAIQYVTLSPSGYINLEYTVCSSNSSSCPSCSSLGTFGVTFYTNPTSIKVVNQDYGTTTITGPVNGIYSVNFTSSNPPCPAGNTIPTPQTYASIPYRGVNLAGADFNTFYPPCACDAVYFVNQGATTMRLPVFWEYLQSTTPLGDPIDFTTGDALVYSNLVTQLTTSGLYVIIDMHNYMRYNAAAPGVYITGDNYIIGNTSVVPGVINGPTTAQYAAAWHSIATQFANNPLVIFDLMNEPNDMPTSLVLYNYYNTDNTGAITAIRDAEIAASAPPHLILLEGNSYTCLGSWSGPTGTGYDVANSEIFVPANIVDPGNNYAINVHEYFNGGDDANPAPTTPCGDGSTNCVNAADVLTTENFPAFASYLQTNGLRAFLSELNGIANENCAACVNNMLSGLETIPYSVGAGYGFIGWTGWSGGAFPTSYILNLTPTYSGSTQTQTIQMLEGFNLHMTPL